MPVRLLLAQAWYFYPRPPRGGRPLLPSMAARARAISIHALREEGDFLTCRVYNMHKNFYPRPPRGGRLVEWPMMALPLSFLSTPSARRATAGELLRRKGRRISIHALREEGDVRRLESARTCTDFYPRPPRGGRLMTIWALQRRTIFLSTPSARRATTRRPRSNPQCGISIHALREEGDVASINLTSSIFQFLSTPSARRATPRRR